MEISPVDGTHRTSGHLIAEGRIPLAMPPPAGEAAAGAAAPGAPAGGPLAVPVLGGGPGGVALRRDHTMDVRVNVKDGGMAILTSVTPDLRWQQGNADVAFRCAEGAGQAWDV